MRRYYFSGLFAVCLCLASSHVYGVDRASLSHEVQRCYMKWRESMVKRNYKEWNNMTSIHQKIKVRNRLYSEKRPIPSSIFNVPAPPPTLKGLKLARLREKGGRVKAVFFGKVDFNIGGNPTDNLLVLSFAREQRAWKYDGAEFISLSGLPDVRKKLQAGNVEVLDKPEFEVSNLQNTSGTNLRGPVPYIAKVYVFCPGREVSINVNGVSRHKFQNTKQAEVVIGGAKRGANQVKYNIKKLPGSTGKEALAIRVYLMSEISGTKPIKAFEYLVNENEKVRMAGEGGFTLTPDIAQKLAPTRAKR